MIELNITLFVQMVHFFFAWWFLDTFLCKYLVQAVQQEQQMQDELVGHVDGENKQLEELKLDQEKRWLQWCSRFRSAVPILCVDTDKQEFLIKKFPAQKPSQEEAQKTVTVVAEHVVQRILHE